MIWMGEMSQKLRVQGPLFWLLSCVVGVSFATTVYQTHDSSGHVLLTDQAPSSLHGVKVIHLQDYGTAPRRLTSAKPSQPAEVLHQSLALSQNLLSNLQHPQTQASNTPQPTDALAAAKAEQRGKLAALHSQLTFQEGVVQHASSRLSRAREAYAKVFEEFSHSKSVSVQDEVLREQRLHLMSNVILLAKDKVEQAKQRLQAVKNSLETLEHSANG
jgi:predicted S18 family serine protease